MADRDRCLRGSFPERRVVATIAGQKGVRPATIASGAGRDAGVQLRFETSLTSDEYVSQQAWSRASLERCPWHATGGCGLKGHGTYTRLDPPGAKIARFYCRKAQATVSLLPDCLAAKLPGSLAEIEQVIVTVEEAATVEAAADRQRPDVEMPGRLRWVRRRLGQVYAGLLALRTLLPERFGECAPSVCAFRDCLGVEPVMPLLRAYGAEHLHALPPPLGFGPRRSVSLRFMKYQQHSVGPRAPPSRS